MEQQEQIGSYILTKTLGKGTFGKVRLATHIPTNEKVAIKVLVKAKIKDSGDVERVSREIQILKMTRHPNIVQLYEIIETSTALYLVMEYASEGELFNYIVKRKALDEKDAARLFWQIIQAIEYVHRLNIMHRDLKPENLLLDDNKIKLVDFGLSNTYKTGGVLKTACGSPCYAAPEMIAGKRYKPLKADIWSSGVVLFAMLCGYLPFEDPNTKRLYKKIMQGQYQLPKNISVQAQDLLRQILNTNPDKRYSINQIRSHIWFHQSHPPILKGLVLKLHRVPIDELILSHLQEDHGIDDITAKAALAANKHNSITTTYYLLLKARLKQGATSIADIESSSFKPSLLPRRGTSQDKRKQSESMALTLPAAVMKPRYRDVRTQHEIRRSSRDQSLQPLQPDAIRSIPRPMEPNQQRMSLTTRAAHSRNISYINSSRLRSMGDHSPRSNLSTVSSPRWSKVQSTSPTSPLDRIQTRAGGYRLPSRNTIRLRTPATKGIFITPK